MELTPLATLDCGAHTAAIARDPTGAYWLTSWLGRGGTGLDEFAPGIEGIEGATITGGRAPRGAVVAEVRDRRGEVHRVRVVGGAWICRLDGEPTGERPPVAFRDSAGSLVRPPYREGTERDSVPEAVTPCPACGANSWERLRYVKHWGGGSDGFDEPRDELACGACGHAEDVPQFYGSADWEESVEDESTGFGRDAQPSDYDDPFPAMAAAALARAQEAFPIYGVLDWAGPRSVGGWSGSGDHIDAITLIHGVPDTANGPRVEVCTEARDDHFGLEEIARRRLSELLHPGGGWPQLPEEALALWLHAQRREQMAAAAAAELRTEAITVGGEPLTFLCVSAAGWWTGVADHANVRLLVASAGMAPDDIRLDVVADGAPYVDATV
ncbi:MAG: hypothetical protein ACJ76Z_17035 [Thermoleophilaceae bacterium]